MSQENVELARRAFQAFNGQGLDGLLLYLHPEIEWTTTGAFLEAATYRGHDEVRRYIGALVNEFVDIHIEVEEVIDAGDQVVITARISGRGKSSGAPVELVMTTVGSQREGKIVRLHNFMDKGEALEAAGL
jgi:ketosteroid isomerase-like protein